MENGNKTTGILPAAGDKMLRSKNIAFCCLKQEIILVKPLGCRSFCNYLKKNDTRMCCHIWSDLFGGLTRHHLVGVVAFRDVREGRDNMCEIDCRTPLCMHGLL